MIQKTNFYKIKLKIGEVELEIEGDREFVKERFEEMKPILYEKIEEVPSKLEEPAKVKRVISRKITPKKPKVKKTLDFDVQKVKDMIKDKKLKDPIEKAAAVLFHFSSELGKPSLKTKDLKRALDLIGTRIKNIYFLLKKNEKLEKPLLEKVGRGEWKLTEAGKKIFK